MSNPPRIDDFMSKEQDTMGLLAERERAYQALELCGVPRERARSVANGIQVFMTRTDRERRAFEETIRRLEAEVKALKAELCSKRHYDGQG